MSCFAASPRDARKRAAKSPRTPPPSMSGSPLGERVEADLRRRERRIEGEIGLHPQMRPTVQLNLFEHAPMQALKQWRVLVLHMGEETTAAARVGRGDGESDQRGA